MSKAEEAFLRLGKRGVAILVNRDNENARAFWNAAGYDEYPDLIEGWKYLYETARRDGGYVGGE